MASRRADAVGVIASAAVASALHGTGTARIGADLDVPAATVRGWLRRLRARAGAMRQDAMVIFGHLTAGRDAPFPEPSGSALGDALSAVAACAHAAITFRGRAAPDWEPLLGLFGLARFLAPAPGS
jgi:transposase-like protein